MSDLFLDDLVSDALFSDDNEETEREELEFGTYDMKIIKIKNDVNKNETPYILISCEKDGSFANVPFYFTEKSKAYSTERLVKLCKKLTGSFTFKKKLDLETLVDSLKPIIGKTVEVEIYEKDGYTNYKIS